MTETDLITISDIREYRELSQNYNATRLGGYIQEAQRTHLRELLGDGLWYDFFSNITDEKYVTLRDGGESFTNSDGDTAQYFGLKPFLVYYVLYIDAREGSYFHTNTGPATFEPEQTSRPSTSQRNEITAGYLKQATFYANNIIDFLNENGTTYPLWDDRRERDVSQFNFSII